MSSLSRMSRAISVVAFFIVTTIIMYLLHENGFIPYIIFIIGFGIVILLSVGIMFYPVSEGQWKEITVIPMKRKK